MLSSPVGHFVVKSDSGGNIGVKFESYGMGKFEDHDDDIVTISYFGRPVGEPVRVQAPFSSVRPAVLSRHIRFYCCEIGQGERRIGRLLDDNSNTQFVSFPDGSDRLPNVADQFERWDLPVFNPTPSFNGKGEKQEPEIFFIHRSARASCQ